MHKFLALCLFSLILIGYVPTAVSGILFYDDCEDTPNTSDWRLQTSGNVSFSVSSEQVRAGSKSYKYVHNGTPGVMMRVEHALVKSSFYSFDYNTVYWIGYSFYITEDSEYERGIYGQFHGRPDQPIGECDQYRHSVYYMSPDESAGGIVILQKAQTDRCAYNPDGPVYSRTKYYKRSQRLNKGQWHDIVLQFRFSYVEGGGGFFKIWLNGTQILDDEGINCFNDTKGPYWKMGLYATNDFPMTAYYDEFRVGDSNSSYDEVSPKGPNTISLNAPLLKIVN
jgi:hypothetical protein